MARVTLYPYEVVIIHWAHPPLQSGSEYGEVIIHTKSIWIIGFSRAREGRALIMIILYTGSLFFVCQSCKIWIMAVISVQLPMCFQCSWRKTITVWREAFGFNTVSLCACLLHFLKWYLGNLIYLASITSWKNVGVLVATVVIQTVIVSHWFFFSAYFLLSGGCLKERDENDG